MSRTLVKMVGDYELGAKLGEGNFAKVREGTHSTTGEKYAIKIVTKAKVHTDKQMIAQFQREICICKQLKHANVAQMHEVLQSSKSYYLVFELVTGGTLFDHLVANKGPLPEETARKMFGQLMLAVDYFHNEGVAHRDIKPENILLDKDLNVKVTDFGLANVQKTKGQALETCCGSPHYVAPEVLDEKPYDGFPVDVWSCGVVLYMLLTGRRPFDGVNIVAIFRSIERGAVVFPPGLPPRAVQLVKLMLTPDPKKRITVEEVLAHDWVQGARSMLLPPVTTAAPRRKRSVLSESLLASAFKPTEDPLDSSTRSSAPPSPQMAPQQASRRSTESSLPASLGNSVSLEASQTISELETPEQEVIVTGGIQNVFQALLKLRAAPVIGKDDANLIKGVCPIVAEKAVTTFSATVDDAAEGEPCVVNFRVLRGDPSILNDLVCKLTAAIPF